MPTLPAFRRRLDQTVSNPMYQQAASTPMEFGLPARDAIGQNPAWRPRSANGGIVPLIQPQQEQLPPPSGTSERPSLSPSYESMAPRMEEIPNDPTFQGHEKHGFLDRIRAAFYGGNAVAAQQPENEFGRLGGMIGGLINPGGAEKLNFEEVELPRARKKQQAVMERNASREKMFSSELANRERVAKINQMNDPEWQSVAGAENPTLYDKRSGATRPVLGPDGKPIRAATVTNTEMRTKSAEDIAFEKRLADAEKLAEQSRVKFEIEKVKFEHQKQIKDLENKFKDQIEKLKEYGRNRRAVQSEGGKNSRNKQNLDERKRANNLRYGDDDTKSGKQAPPPAN